MKINIKIGVWDLYDYLLTHEYKKPVSIIATLLGIAAIIFFFVHSHAVMHLIIGVLVVVYLPWTLLLNCFVKLKTIPSFSKTLEYELNDEGIRVSQEGAVESQRWENMFKARASMRSIILYTAKNSASILPKKQLKSQLDDRYHEAILLIQSKMNVQLK